MKKVLLVDLDNTIVTCSLYYEKARQTVVDNLLSTGIEEALLVELTQYLSVWAARARGQAGFARHTFPRSLAATVCAANCIALDKVDPYPAVQAYHAGDAVFDASYDPYPGALAALTAFRTAGWYVVILTKGDTDIQSWKLDKHNIRELVDRVFVVPIKDATVLQAVCEQLGVAPSECVYVGDSVRDDINPGIALGMTVAQILIAPEEQGPHDGVTPTRTPDYIEESLYAFAQHMGVL